MLSRDGVSYRREVRAKSISMGSVSIGFFYSFWDLHQIYSLPFAMKEQVGKIGTFYEDEY